MDGRTAAVTRGLAAGPAGPDRLVGRLAGVSPPLRCGGEWL